MIVVLTTILNWPPVCHRWWTEVWTNEQTWTKTPENTNPEKEHGDSDGKRKCGFRAKIKRQECMTLSFIMSSNWRKLDNKKRNFGGYIGGPGGSSDYVHFIFNKNIEIHGSWLIGFAHLIHTLHKKKQNLVTSCSVFRKLESSYSISLVNWTALKMEIHVQASWLVRVWSLKRPAFIGVLLRWSLPLKLHYISKGLGVLAWG